MNIWFDFLEMEDVDERLTGLQVNRPHPPQRYKRIGKGKTVDSIFGKLLQAKIC